MPTRFKVGDRVRCIDDACVGDHRLVKGALYVIDALVGHYVDVKGVSTGPWSNSRFELYTPEPHKHADLIKQWADNPQLKFQFRGHDARYDDWTDSNGCPSWHEKLDYRVKPESKPDTAQYFEVTDEYVHRQGEGGKAANVKFTFDGETRELKSVEKI